MTTRCPWPGQDPLYLDYHDTEWGVPEHDDRALFGKLILDGFQAGLSWITILRKRENFRATFNGFDPEHVARYDSAKVDALMSDAGIVRNRAKIEAAIGSAKAFLDLREGGEAFDSFLWQFTGGSTIRNHWKRMEDIPAETRESKLMSKALKERGFRFCGPTICYAFMQATGMVNDHVVDCFRHGELQSQAVANLA
ncbi:MAG: DNA-3-methyladenine glycosylase I [Proteobacteria bacterium]|nr:DNA-3-methyladenine glycosylase I [Pseudomonadota bacterium]